MLVWAIFFLSYGPMDVAEFYRSNCTVPNPDTK